MKVVLVPPAYLNSHQHQVQVYADHGGGMPGIGTAQEVFQAVDHLPRYLSIYAIEQTNCVYIGRANLIQNIWGMGEIEQWVAENCQGVVLAQFCADDAIMLYFEDGHARSGEFARWLHAQRRRTQFILRVGKRNLLDEMKAWLKENGTGKIDFMKRANTIAIADQKTATKFLLMFSDNVEEHT